MTSFKSVLLDLGGVVYVGKTPLQGAIAAIHRLRARGLDLRFLTNTTRTPHRALCTELRAMQIPFAPQEVFTPALAARRLIEAQGYAPHFLIHPALKPDFARLKRGTKGVAVVVGDAGNTFTYKAMNAAFRALNDNAAFLALANNRSFRDSDGHLSLDAGPFVAALQFASRREPVILGKPSRDFFQAALDSLGCAPQDCVMIGDDVESDVAGAMAAGIPGILVRTGKYAVGDETRIDPAPTYVADDLAGAVEWLVTR